MYQAEWKRKATIGGRLYDLPHTVRHGPRQKHSTDNASYPVSDGSRVCSTVFSASVWCRLRMLCLREAQPHLCRCKHFGHTEIIAAECLASCQLLSSRLINIHHVFTQNRKASAVCGFVICFTWVSFWIFKIIMLKSARLLSHPICIGPTQCCAFCERSTDRLQVPSYELSVCVTRWMDRFLGSVEKDC